MRHDAAMRAFLLLSFLFATCAVADEKADRAAIARTIAALNEVPQPRPLFTADADSSLVVDVSGKPMRFRLLQPFGSAVSEPVSHPTW